MLAYELVDLGGVDLASEQVRDLSPEVPRRVVLEPAAVALEQQRGHAGGSDLVEDRRAVAGLEAIGQPLELAIEHETTADLEDVGGGADQARSLEHRALATPRVDDDLDARAVTRLERADGVKAERAVGVAEQ